MTDDQPVFGFDGTADGTMTVVTLRRDPEHGWQVETVDGPEHPDLSAIAGRLVARIAEPRPAPATPPLDELVEQWMAKHQGTTFQLTDEHRATVEATFRRLVTEGKLTLGR